MEFTFYALRFTLYDTMIWHITQKELLVNLLSLRFSIGLVVVMLMMGLVGYVLVEDHTARQQTYLSDVQRHQKDLEETKVYSKLEVVVDIPPSPLSVFSRGVRDLPSSIRVSPYHVPSLIDEGETSMSIDLSGTSNRPYNPLLRMFASIDLSFVISMILSLFAIILVFDSFSGEQEQGTLKLILSCPAGRLQLLIGKFLGALLTMAIPLTLGFLEVMLLWSLSPNVSLAASSWLGVGLIYIFSLIFLAGFLALGLLISLFAKESSSGLMYLLLAWVLVAIVIPAGVGYLAEYTRPRESGEKLTQGLDKQFYEVYNKVEYKQKSSWWVAHTNPKSGESFLAISRDEAYNRVEFNKKVFPLKFQYAEDRYRVMEDYTARLQRWKRARNALIRPSLCVVYRNIVTAISGTNIESYDDALRRARAYRDVLMSYLRPKVGTPQWITRVLEYPEIQLTDENIRYWNKLAQKEGRDVYDKILNWDRVAPLELRDMPIPHIEFSGLAERLERERLDVLLLVVLTACFLFLSVWRVLHYRVQ